MFVLLEQITTLISALQHKVQFLSTDLEKVRSEKADEMALRVQVENKLRVCTLDIIYEPRCEKTGLRDFRPGPIQTGLYNPTQAG